MIVFWLCIVCALGMMLAQDVFPGAALYHYGWYSILGIAFLVVAATSKKREPLVLFGCAIVVFAGAAAGLMAPDTHTVVGAPGASVRDEDLGATVQFPLDGTAIRVVRGNSVVVIDGGRRYTGAFILWAKPRDVVDVRVADARGNHLTITQPTNASFLSPVLMMQQNTAIAGMNVRFDTFSVPAERINVKAVLFSEQQAAQLRTDPPIVRRAAVLYDVYDESDREVSGGIGIVPSGSQKAIGGLIFAARVRSYPALAVASAPYWPALAIGVALCIAGTVRALPRRSA